MNYNLKMRLEVLKRIFSSIKKRLCIAQSRFLLSVKLLFIFVFVLPRDVLREPLVKVKEEFDEREVEL